MTNNPKDMLDNIPIPDELDQRIELGFDQAKKDKNARRHKSKRAFIAIAASLFIVISSLSFIGFDKVKAAIKQVLHYVPGYNIVVESDDGHVLVLKDQVLYDEDGVYVKITAASKIDEKLLISIESNHKAIDYADSNETNKIQVEDESSNVFSTDTWVMAGDGVTWQGDYSFEVEGDYSNYSLLVGDLEIPFELEKGTEADDFLQFGNNASDKGIDIVAIKEPMENRLMISLLHQSEEKIVTDYPFEHALLFSDWSKEEIEFEKSMYILDREGKKFYPTFPSSFGNFMSDFYFNIKDQEGLKLVLPYVKTQYNDLRSDKISIQVPSDGESIDINEIFSLGDFDITVFDVKRQEQEIIISFTWDSLEDEILDYVYIGGISGYGLNQDILTGHREISINVRDVGKSFSIFFEGPEVLLFGDWVIDLD